MRSDRGLDPDRMLPPMGAPDGHRQRPSWFDESIDAVLDGAGALMAARGPRELDDAAARLLGAEQLHRLRTHASGFWFDWWYGELADAAATRARDGVAETEPKRKRKRNRMPGRHPSGCCMP